MHIDGKHACMLYEFICETTMSSLMVPCVLDKYVLNFHLIQQTDTCNTIR